jgi:hypothetical protein
MSLRSGLVSLLWRCVLPTISCLAVSIVLVGILGHVFYGTIYALPALARGHLVVVEPASQGGGVFRVGEETIVPFALKNLSSRAVTVNGVSTSCTCLRATELPLQIPAKSERILYVRVRPTAEQASKKFMQDIELYLNVVGQRPSFSIGGRVEVIQATN